MEAITPSCKMRAVAESLRALMSDGGEAGLAPRARGQGPRFRGSGVQGLRGSGVQEWKNWVRKDDPDNCGTHLLWMWHLYLSPRPRLWQPEYPPPQAPPYTLYLHPVPRPEALHDALEIIDPSGVPRPQDPKQSCRTRKAGKRTDAKCSGQLRSLDPEGERAPFRALRPSTPATSPLLAPDADAPSAPQPSHPTLSAQSSTLTITTLPNTHIWIRQELGGPDQGEGVCGEDRGSAAEAR
eukprot:2129608-Rhodomonas_salina.2